MDPEDNPKTISELINSLLSEGGDAFSIGFDQNSITELNGTYTVTFVCVLDEKLPSQFGDIDVGTLPLTDEHEYTIQPSFAFTTKPLDAVFIGTTICEATASHGPDASADLSRLKQFCSEVHLDEQQLVDFVDGDETVHEPVQHVEVSCFPQEPQSVGSFVQAVAAGQPQQPPTVDGEGINFTMTIRGSYSGYIDGIPLRDRFAHVDTISINGQRYPATITTIAFKNWTDSGQGQYIYTSNILANNTDTPKIDLSDELDRINWEEFFASERPWPESPQFALSQK